MSPRAGLRFGFWFVFRREFRWFRRRPLLLAVVTVVPLLLAGILGAVFHAGLATSLPVAVLDLDGSNLSRTLTRMVDATPEAAVTRKVQDLAEGKALIRSGEIHGLLMIPRNLQRDVQARRRPEIVLFYNTQTLSTGNQVLRAVRGAAATAEAGIRIALRTASGQPVAIAATRLQPIPVQLNALFNPTLNYIHFLLATVIPAVLQVIIVTASAYSIGLDVETRHRLATLGRLGGGILPAMAGKLLPYTLIFLGVLGLSDALLFGLLEMPLRGHRELLLLAGTLFILACQLLGATLALALNSGASAVSIGTLLTAPAFGYMGIGFPRIAMNAFAHAWGALLPGTWYLMARIDQTVRGTPADLSWPPILALAAMVLVWGALSAALLAVRRRRRLRAAPPPRLARLAA